MAKLMLSIKVEGHLLIVFIGRQHFVVLLPAHHGCWRADSSRGQGHGLTFLNCIVLHTLNKLGWLHLLTF